MKKIVLFLFFVFYIPSNAYAYIDPGTGSMLLTALVASLAAIGTTTSIYWSKIKSFFSKKEKNDKPPNN